ncbi:MAG TPA: 3-deoxy-8-phosphooctulonate synthase [Longimicrobiales bacterium]
MFALDDPFFLIAGPCVLEDDALNLRIAEELARISAELTLPIIYKASFDKANRSKAGAARGPGLQEGLRKLERVRTETGLPILTDVHEAAQCAAAAEVCDVLQIPAFLSRQTDLVVAAAATRRAINIKKGQWMAPEEMTGAVGKARKAGANGIAVTERGTFFGYGDLIVDMRSFARMRAATDCPVVFDGTHSVQQPGRADGASGGQPEFIPTLVRAAAAAGIDGLFLETHPQPEKAPSDSTNMLRLDVLRDLLDEVLAIRDVMVRARAR